MITGTMFLDHRAEGDAWPPAGTSIPGASQRVPGDGHGLERERGKFRRARSCPEELPRVGIVCSTAAAVARKQRALTHKNISEDTLP
ncbi:MAG: hypothetical protein PHP26_03155 [Syntrophomonas sp.]|uniref:hypothetical protein n=1 Tax=Syntrophomonas sp. TaxID=2053627 RepID=UPI0026213943|nr:hypothetical protein [Syntrophomonas sp.]MDD2509901.1 hypothetical protein [Syntrophomonas sp.]MDD3878972.1 hypothetical protein [Syntrophomonas sp.]MDD4626713.1 hypothetical protein [Syntrophomonas sp.]